MNNFFEESLQAVDYVGNPVLANGDVIKMDNSDFHNGIFVENQLRLMLRNRGVELIFQPPYIVDFDSLTSQSSQVSRIERETHANKFNLTL